MPVSPTLIFDCDGVLADTERFGHLPAFNRTFDQVGLLVRWSEDDYAEYVKIGGGKERMASLLTPEFVARAGLPTDPDEQKAMIADWHRRKTVAYVDIVTSGAIPGRPGIARIVEEAAAAGWRLAVASTSAEVSVRAVLEHTVGSERARDFAIFAGDVVPRKKPAPDIYLHALEQLDVDPAEVVVVEDSANGLRAARAAGLTTIVTVNAYTADEDFTGAALIVTCLGDAPHEPVRVIDDPHGLDPGDEVTLAELSRLISPSKERPTMAVEQADVEFVVRVIAQTAVDNEKYFGDLDSVVGDGDFGYSLARGFEIVLADWDTLDRTGPGAFLQKIAMLVTSRIGGTSGPIWGTAFLRAGGVAKKSETLDGATVVEMLTAAIDGIKARGGAEVGEKTLLDAVVPMRDTIAELVAQGAGGQAVLDAAATTARTSAEATSLLQARRGRASYTGERSIGSPDAGAMGVAVIVEQIAEQWRQRGTTSA